MFCLSRLAFISPVARLNQRILLTVDFLIYIANNE